MLNVVDYIATPSISKLTVAQLINKIFTLHEINIKGTHILLFGMVTADYALVASCVMFAAIEEHVMDVGISWRIHRMEWHHDIDAAILCI